MATSKNQRMGIWIITGALVLGTLAGFAAMILVPKNEQTDQQRQEKAYEEMMAQYAEQQKEDRKKNRPLKGHEAKPFDGDEIEKLKVEVLEKGEGKKLKADSTISANYFGWMPDGTIFDSTNKEGKTEPTEFALDKVIEGWAKGLTGVRVGSVVRLTVPSDMAYGDTDNGMGSPTGPLKFIIEVKELN